VADVVIVVVPDVIAAVAVFEVTLDVVVSSTRH